MDRNVKKMKPIWFFVGWVLVVIGGLILATGLYDLWAQAESKTVLSYLHPDIWWGAIMVVAGLAFVLKNRNVSIE